MDASLFTFDFLYDSSNRTVSGTITCNGTFKGPVFVVNWDVERHDTSFKVSTLSCNLLKYTIYYVNEYILLILERMN